MSNITASASNAAGIEPLRAKWGWIVALGAVYAIAGLIALGSVLMATVATVYVVGFMMLISGIAEVINSFQVKSWGKFLLWALLGVLYIIAGFVTFENPLLAAALLTLMLGCALVISGVMRIILGFSMKHGMPWLWVVLSGVVTLLLGLIILDRWPISSLYILGLLLGIDLVFAGASWMGIGLRLRRA
ncbi:MAG TPA: HdeD family acid-resistance protein [Pseudolabrys sp.]|nr:HdeD family acid-resistance protein [Pseudolabrys sp.]